MRISVTAADDNPLYAFFAPLTAACWSALGYEPHTLLVESASWAHGVHGVILSTLEAISTVHYVPRAEGLSSATVAQFARLYAGFLSVPGNAYTLVADMDLWPIRCGDNWEQDRRHPDEITVHFDMRQYGGAAPIGCGVGAPAHIWRALTGEGPLSALPGRMLRDTEGMDGDRWCWDERFFKTRLDTRTDVRCVLRQGNPPSDRIDRSAWPSRLDLTGKADAHLLRPGHTLENWNRLRELFARLVPERVGWADDYRARFVAALGGG